MNKKLYRTGIDFINIALVLLVAYSVIICFLYSRTNTIVVVPYTLLFMLCPLIYFAAYKIIDNFFLYLLIHIACIAATMYLAPNLLYRIVFGSFLVVFTIFSLYKKNDIVLPKPTSTGRLPAVVMVIAFYFAKGFDTKIIPTLITFAFILYILLYMFNQYLVNTYIFYENTATECLTSFSKSQNTLNKMWGIFLLISTVIMSLSSLLIPTTSLLSTIKKGVTWLLQELLLPLQKNQPNIAVRSYDTAAEEVVNKTATATAQATKSPEVNLLPFIIILALMAIFVIIALVRSSIAGMKTVKEEDDDDRELLHPFKAKLDIEGKRGKKFGAIFGNTTEQKIRKIFYKTITDNVDERLNVRGSLTATQLCDITYECVDKSSLYDMKDIYIKARYSDESCTHKELSNMKELAKKCSQNSTLSSPKKEKYEYREGIGGR